MLGADDPRHRRAPQGESIPEVWVGSGLALDNAGKLSVDPVPLYIQPHQLTRKATAINYTLLPTDQLIGVTSTGAARTITLPPLTSVPKGKCFTIKDEGGGAAANNITVDGAGAETIDGAATKVLATNYESVTIYSSGAAWFSI